MCGIAGLIAADRVEPRLLERMCDAIAHRGPDDHGQWIDSESNVGLGHRRLAIVDLSPSGHQPMTSSNDRFVLSYNGEIYNHVAMRAELEAQGLVSDGGWNGHSDTETLLAAIAGWGLETAIERAVGMFAFALWDRHHRTLSLVRDRFGEKPLYYGWVGRDFVFASELKAIRAHPSFAGEIDRRALHLFTARNYVPAPLSIYRGVFKLEPGCILSVAADAVGHPATEPPRVDATDGPLQLRRYWSYGDVVEASLNDPIDDPQAALDALGDVLARAISDQSVADVPVGAFLSGGIDSSSIVALYQKYSSVAVRTFTIGFEEGGFDEAHHAKAVAVHLGTVHHEHYVSVKEAREVIPLLPAMYDEPFADSSQIPTFLVSRFAREQVTVALTGDGGDELFAGYNRHFTAPQLWNKLRNIPRPLRSLAAAPLGKLPSSFWNHAAGFVGKVHTPAFGAKMQKAVRLGGSAQSLEDIYVGFLDEWSMEQSPARGGDAAGHALNLSGHGCDTVRMMTCDATSYLPDDILCKVDRASMAVSLETRVPFLDHRVAALAARIPLEQKVRGGVGKHILRELLYREAPRALFERPKAGFAVPVGEWIKGPLRPWAEELLDPVRMSEDGWFDPAIVQRRWRDHLSGRRDSTSALWAVLMFQAWRAEQKYGFHSPS